MTRRPAILNPGMNIGVLLAGILLASWPLHASAGNGPGPDHMKIATYEQTATLQFYQRFIKEAYLHLGITTRFTVMPTLRALHATNQGEQDAVLMVSTEAETGANHVVRVAEPLPRLDFRVLARANMPGDTLPADLGPYSVGYLRGIHPLERQFADKTQKLTINGDFDTLLEILELERIDLVVLPGLEAEMLAMRHQELKALRAPVYTFAVFHYVHQDHTGLAPSLATIFREMKQNRLCMATLSEIAHNQDFREDPNTFQDIVNAHDYKPLCPMVSRQGKVSPSIPEPLPR